MKYRLTIYKKYTFVINLLGFKNLKGLITKTNRNIFFEIKLNYIICLLSLASHKNVFSQQVYYPLETSQYNFIQNDKNIFNLFHDSTSYQLFFSKFDSLIQFGEGQLRIVHIGGSHIQADLYTHRMRQHFNAFQPGITGPRGFIFPYKIAQSNNPLNYRVEYTGDWTFCKNTLRNTNCILGLSGYSVTTSDTFASIKINLNMDSTIRFEFNRLKVFHPYTTRDFRLNILPSDLCKIQIRNEQSGYTEYYFDKYLDTIELRIEKTDSLQSRFELYGLSFDSDDPGIIYSAVGVNGAKLESYLRCQLFGNHLQALNPDLIIISIGTNDGYTRRFDADLFEREYREFILQIKKIAPEAAILLTVPNDSYLYRRFLNRNTINMGEIIFDLAKKYNLAVWDFFSVMGGLNSVKEWHDAGLMNNDHVHFSKQGYILKGDLFFAAFLKTWEEFLKEKMR